MAVIAHDKAIGPVFMDCVPPPHIVADPCHPRWVVQCSHGHWFYYHAKDWYDRKNEYKAWLALFGLANRIACLHPPIEGEL
jgi:hypothetical protein